MHSSFSFHRNKQRFREILNLHVVPQRITTNKIKSDSVHKVRFMYLVSCVKNIYIHGIFIKTKIYKIILSYGLFFCIESESISDYAIYSIILMFFVFYFFPVYKNKIYHFFMYFHE